MGNARKTRVISQRVKPGPDPGDFISKAFTERKVSPSSRAGSLLLYSDWPPKARQFGFPLVNSAPRRLSEPLEAFLETGDKPVLWTDGSANFDIRRFQRRALAISRELNLRCLLISLETPEGRCPEGAFHLTHGGAV